MKKVVLVSPSEKHILMEAGDRPNIGICYLSASLRDTGQISTIIDLNHSSYKELSIQLKNADFIGVTIITPNYEWAINFAKHIRHNFPHIELIAGGPHATVAPESLQEYYDYIIIGEGEKAIVDIVKRKLNDNFVKCYSSISPCHHCIIIKYPYEENLDSLPSPYEEIDLKKYGINQEGHRTMIVLGSRSCDFNCCFCTKNILGSRQRFHSINRVIKEIKTVKKKGFDSIYFLDDHFTSNKERTLELCKKIKPLNITYRISTRSDRLDEDIVKALKDSGCRSIGLGLEHMDNEVLKATNKANTVENHLKAIRLLHKHGINVRGEFIINLPKATKETALKTLEIAKQENLKFADWYCLTAYPGTPIWDTPKKFGCKVNKKYGFNQTSAISNVDNGNFGKDNCELEEFVTMIRNDWAKHKNSLCPWEQNK